MIMPRGTLAERPYNIQSHEEVTITEHRSLKKTTPATAQGSAIPMFVKGGSPVRDLPPKHSPTNSPKKKITASQPGSPQKLRMQSPQKVHTIFQYSTS